MGSWHRGSAHASHYQSAMFLREVVGSIPTVSTFVCVGKIPVDKSMISTRGLDEFECGGASGSQSELLFYFI